jgi:hypothetical protein
MATISLTLGANTHSRTFPDGDAARLRTAWKARLGLPAGATNAQVASAVADWVFAEIMGEVLRQDQDAAAKTARDAVTPVVIT